MFRLEVRADDILSEVIGDGMRKTGRIEDKDVAEVVEGLTKKFVELAKENITLISGFVISVTRIK